MERAGEAAGVGSQAGDEADAAVAAHVLERAQHAVVTPDDEYRERAEPVLVEVAGAADVVQAAGELPDPRPEASVLQRGERAVGVARHGDRHGHGATVLRKPLDPGGWGGAKLP